MTNSNSSKNNKFFLCFRPVVAMLDSPVPSHRSSATASHHDEIHNPHNSQPPKRKLSRVLKAMVFETLLNRRARRKNRSRRDSYESDSSYSTRYTEETSSTGDERSICSQTSVDISSIQEINPEARFSSSSSSDSKVLSKSNSCPLETKPRKRNRRDPLEKKPNNLDCSGIYMLLLILILTVFCGKVLGILLTSICLYSYSVFKKDIRGIKQRRETARTGEAAIKGIKFDGKLKQ